MNRSSFAGDNANLDLVRAVAVLEVFFGHLSGIVWRPSEVAWHLAQMGVLIFFVHTSMVLMLSLERNRRQGGALVADFFIRRWFRIYPLAIVCVTIAFIFATDRSWAVYAANVTLTTNLTYMPDLVVGLWTLPLEVQMYIALPVLFLLFRNVRVRWIVAAWAIAVILGLAQPHISGRLNVLAFAPCFLGGILAWRLSQDHSPNRSGAWWPLAFLATWAIWLPASRELHLYYRWAFCLALGFTIPWFREIPWKPVKAAAKTIAKYSYGIYLSHFAIMEFAFGTLAARPAIVQWTVFAALAVSVPVILYHAVEQPMINLGRRIAERRQPTALPAAQPVGVQAAV
jgi:peptidoglycan/LPS O-acetylase OafA/YrhL